MNAKNNSKAVIVSMSAHGERIAAAAGRISTGKGTATQILSKSFDTVKNAKLIVKVNASGHNSTLEHTFYNIAFEDVSVFAEQFIIEFRLASFTVKSRRYVDFADSGYYVPDLPEEACDIYTSVMDKCYAAYSDFVEAGIPKEDARFILPYSLQSNILCSLNAREMLRMLRAMLYGRGKDFPELKQLGESLLEQIKILTPGIAESFCPPAKEITDTPSFTYVKTAEKDDAPVRLIARTQDAENLIARTALISDGYCDADCDRILSDESNTAKIIESIMRSDRPRALENAVYTFRINGVSLSTITHFTRHRMQSILVPALTSADRSRFIIPETIKADKNVLDKYLALFAEIEDTYKTLLLKGIDKNTLVYMLLSGNTLDIVSTMNARELHLFFRLRTCNRAQWEVREFAEAMLNACREANPLLFSYYGPGCCVSGCPEGRMSCGRAAEMQAKYKTILKK